MMSTLHSDFKRGSINTVADLAWLIFMYRQREHVLGLGLTRPKLTQVMPNPKGGGSASAEKSGEFQV